MQRTAVLNVVGLSGTLLSEHTPHLRRFRERGSFAPIAPAFPAVTCTAQANYLTGRLPRDHGIVGNGWYHRELAEVHFWKQSNHLVTAPKLWDELRACDPQFTCAKLFWWFNMYSTADYSITPRPMYPADGRKVFDIYTRPAAVRHEIQRDLGPFPFATFWGPAAGVTSPQGGPDAATRWIAESAKWIEGRFQPTLNLIYLPHLDYNLQRYGVSDGPSDGPRLKAQIVPDLRASDAIAGELIAFFEARGVQVIVLSEYGLVNVERPIHLNREFRRRGWIAVREELGRELLDCGASQVFAVADHQVAHVYLSDPRIAGEVREVIEQTGAEVLGAAEKAAAGLDHPRAGDLIAVAPQNSWFTYYYWLDDAVAPDFARCVDIHRKPGYDPVELFADPSFSPLGLRAKIAWRLLQKRLGFRMLMDVIPLDAGLVKGSHGVRSANQADWPVMLTGKPGQLPAGPIESDQVYHRLRHLITAGK
ncbi:MAG: alkaline phosphatase family protein [Verrucomicrobia bacterium]|nr:alkaline phosphatase family protein [Verrucomicrobiota bacterium]